MQGFFGGKYNEVIGKVKRGTKTLYSIRGFWDSEIYIGEGKVLIYIFNGF